MYNLKTQALVFKGYRRGKAAKIPVNRNLYTYDQVKDLDNYGANCNDGIIDVSFDDIDMSNKILDILADQGIYTYCINSPHGVHTYWHTNKPFKDGTDVILALGIKADIHSHGTYIPLKCDGVLREETFEDSNFDSIPELPTMLMPTTSKENLWQLKDGDGRNDALSRHVFALGNMHLSENEIGELFHIINKNIFADSISNDELNTILRPETFEKISTKSFFDEDGKFQPNVFGKYIIDEENVIITNGQLCIYDKDKGFYNSDIRSIKHRMIELFNKISMSRRNEVYDYLKIEAPKKDQSDKRYILFNNGIYDLREKTLLPHSPDYIISNKIPWDYNSNAYNKLVDDTLNKLSCNDADIRAQLEECIGYCFYRDSKLGKCFVFTGAKSNGKSTFIFMLNELLGYDNISSLDLTKLGDKFSTAQLYNKLANIGDDISDDFLCGVDISTFKKVATGNLITGEFKGQDPFDFFPYCSLIFSTNNMPRMKDPTGAVLKRMIIIPFNATFSKNDPDFNPFIQNDLCEREPMEYMAKLGIDALIRVINNNGFTESDAANKEIEQYRIDNDSVLSFIREVGEDGILNQSSSDVYARYETFCATEGTKPVRKSEMHSRIKNSLNLELSSPCTINKRTVRIYVKK